MHDILILNLPKFEANIIPGAPAILKGIANTLGLKSMIYDLNQDWVDLTVKHSLDRKTCLVGISDTNIPNAQVKSLVDHQLTTWASQILKMSPEYLVMSVFSYYGQYFCHQLSRIISAHSDIKIVIGGSGLRVGLHADSDFGKFMKSQGFIYEFLIGDAEKVWLEFLCKEFQKSVEDTDVFLNPKYLPDFTDYDVTRYRASAKRFPDNYLTDQIVVPLSGSKGCVRKCDFCDVHQYWKYEQRKATHIAAEVREVMTVFQECHVEFTDSLINGNIKEFTQLLDQLIEIKQSWPSFTWSSQAIVRSPKLTPEALYAKMAKSGMTCVHIGVETGSDRLRKRMNKKFTNADLDFVLSMLEKYGMQCTLLLFVGHPEETFEDYEETVALFERYKKYANRVIRIVQLNYPMAVNKGTPLYDKKAAKLNIKLTGDPILWYSLSNPELTMAERVRRRLRLNAVLDDLGYTRPMDDASQMQELAVGYSKYKHAIKIINRTD